MKTKKLFLVLLLLLFMFVGLKKVYAYCQGCVVCDYGKYKFEFDGGKATIYVGNEIKTSKPYEVYFKAFSKDDCPKVIYKIKDDGTKLLFSDKKGYLSSIGYTGKETSFKLSAATLTSDYDNYNGDTIKCGNGILEDLPEEIPRIISVIYIIIQVGVPIVLVIFGMMDLFKGVMADKEDEIAKGRQMFIKRLIAAALVFFVFYIVKFVISLASDDSNVINCAECLIRNNCDTGN